MRASRFNPRFSIIATAAISFAFILHAVCFLLIYLRKEHWAPFDQIIWEPEASTIFLIFIPPPLLLITATIVSGRYRLAFFAIFSLAICLCFAFIWIATAQKTISFFMHHSIRDGTDWVGQNIAVRSVSGGIMFEYKHFRHSNDNAAILLRFNSQARPQDKPVYPFFEFPRAKQWLPNVWRAWGFQTATADIRTNSGTQFTFSLTVPIWSLLIACMIFPSWWLYRFFRPKSYNEPGHCRQCGYDLYGNESDKCPECGTPVPPRKNVVAIDTAKPAA